MIYTDGDPELRWASLEDHYTPTRNERNYARRIPGWLVHDFQLYCIGYKLSHRLEGMHGYATTNSFAQDAATREKRIRRAIQYPDPRLKRENFSDNSILTTVPQYNTVVARHGNNHRIRKSLLNFIWGCKVKYPGWTPDEVVIHYRDAETRRRIKDIGELFEAKSKMNQYIRFASLDRDHMPNPPSWGGTRNINAPTPADRDFVKRRIEETLPDLNQMGKWTFEESLYMSGGEFYNRVIHLFTCHDAQHNVVKKMVVKIQAGLGDQIEQLAVEEFGLNRLMTRKGGNALTSIAKCYGWAIRRRAGPIQLAYGYLEYCQFGDLHSLIRNMRGSDKQIPEFFIWLVIRALAEAVMMLWTGITFPPAQTEDDDNFTDDDVRGPGWIRFINIDIKPPNVCLGDPHPSYPGFKSVKMIDFGLCYPNDYPSFRDASRMLVGLPLGTPGWKSVEMMPHLDLQYYKVNPVSACSTVANIGLIALNLMEGRHLPYPGWDRNLRIYPEMNDFSNEYKNMYSSTLRDFVFKCLLHNTKNRPSMWQMLHTSKVNIERWQTKNGDLSDKAIEDLDERDRMIFRDGKWYVGPAGPQRTGPATSRNQASGNNNEGGGGNHDNNNSNKRQGSPSGQRGPGKRQRTSRQTGVARKRPRTEF